MWLLKTILLADWRNSADGAMCNAFKAGWRPPTNQAYRKAAAPDHKAATVFVLTPAGTSHRRGATRSGVVMKSGWFKWLWFTLMVITTVSVSADAQNSMPSSHPAAATINAFYATLVETMKQGKTLGFEGRVQKLAPAVDDAFDISVMTQFAVGPSWTGMTQADRNSVIAAFRRYTIADYAHNFDSYSGERFTVDPNVIVRGPDHIVQTKLLPNRGDPVTLNYRMRQSGSKWKIVDVFLNGFVSELATRRSDFASTVAAGGGAVLTAKLNTLSDNLAK
jgi:phospholipid transport system substrate-binding protein